MTFSNKLSIAYETISCCRSTFFLNVLSYRNHQPIGVQKPDLKLNTPENNFDLKSVVKIQQFWA